MKKLFIIAAMAAVATTASAQKSEITKARAAFDLSSKVETYKEDGVEKQRSIIVNEKLDEAKALMGKAKEAWDAAKADPKKASKIKPEVIAMGYDLKGEIHQRYMARELNSYIDKQPMDTMLFYTSITECLKAYDECAKYDAKGLYTAKNELAFNNFRVYYMYAGQMFSTINKPELAAEAFDRWLNFAKDYAIVKGDETVGNTEKNEYDRGMVAYYAALSLFQAKKYDGMPKFEEEAMKYDKESDIVRQIYIAAALEQGDTATWEAKSHKFALEGKGGEGVVQNLLAYYFQKGDTEHVMAFAKELESALPDNKMGTYAQGIVLMNAAKYEEAAEMFEKTLAIEPDYIDALYNAGVCLCNQGYALNDALSGRKIGKNFTKADNDREIEKIKALYSKAEPYFLKIQELVPDQPERWARRLSTIYYILKDEAKQKEYEALAD